MIKIPIQEFKDNLIVVNKEKNEVTKRLHKKTYSTRQYFGYSRINAKYIELSKKYASFVDRDEIFSQMVVIILDLIKNKDYIKIAKSKKSDEISWIITTTEQRMWDYIQKNYTMNYRSRTGDTYTYNNHFVKHDEDGNIVDYQIISFDDYTYIGSGKYISNHEIYQVGNYDPCEYEHLLGLKKLDKLMTKCKLTNSQKDLVLALEKTRDTDSGIYNQVRAAKLLNKKQPSVNRSWNVIKNKIYKQLAPKIEMTEKERFYQKVIAFLNSDIDEKDVCHWIGDNINSEFVFDIFNKLPLTSRHKLIMAYNTEPVSWQYVKKECVEFLSELYKNVIGVQYIDTEGVVLDNSLDGDND